jgi:hypothetical protein
VASIAPTAARSPWRRAALFAPDANAGSGQLRRHPDQRPAPVQEDICRLQVAVRFAGLLFPGLEGVQQALGQRAQGVALGPERLDKRLQRTLLPRQDHEGALGTAPAGEHLQDRAVLLRILLLALGREQPPLDGIEPAHIGGGRRVENLQRETPRPAVGGHGLMHTGEGGPARASV